MLLFFVSVDIKINKINIASTKIDKIKKYVVCIIMEWEKKYEMR